MNKQTSKRDSFEVNKPLKYKKGAIYFFHIVKCLGYKLDDNHFNDIIKVFSDINTIDDIIDNQPIIITLELYKIINKLNKNGSYQINIFEDQAILQVLERVNTHEQKIKALGHFENILRSQLHLRNTTKLAIFKSMRVQEGIETLNLITSLSHIKLSQRDQSILETIAGMGNLRDSTQDFKEDYDNGEIKLKVNMVNRFFLRGSIITKMLRATLPVIYKISKYPESKHLRKKVFSFVVATIFNLKTPQTGKFNPKNHFEAKHENIFK